MLAPLTSLVGECGHTKTTKQLKGRKKPWHWEEVHQKAFNDVKDTITRDVTLAYPDYSQGFKYTLMVPRDNLEPSLLKITGQLPSSAENFLLVSKNIA